MAKIEAETLPKAQRLASIKNLKRQFNPEGLTTASLVAMTPFASCRHTTGLIRHLS